MLLYAYSRSLATCATRIHISSFEILVGTDFQTPVEGFTNVLEKCPIILVLFPLSLLYATVRILERTSRLALRVY
jgi:hypothetical protein